MHGNDKHYRMVLSVGERNETGRCKPVHKNSFHSVSYVGCGDWVSMLFSIPLYVANITSACGHDTKVKTRYRKSKFHKCGINFLNLNYTGTIIISANNSMLTQGKGKVRKCRSQSRMQKT